MIHSNDYRKTKRLQLRVPPDLLQMIQQVQLRSGMQLTVSDIVRAAIIQYCRERV